MISQPSTNTIDSITLTEDEASDLVNVLRWAIDQGIGYGHMFPDDPEYVAAENARKVLLGKIARPLERTRKRNARKGHNP